MKTNTRSQRPFKTTFTFVCFFLLAVFSAMAATTQTATVHLQWTFGFEGAIICDNPGNPNNKNINTEASQVGNVVINADTSGATIIDGGEGRTAILANGGVNIAAAANVPANAVSMTNLNTVDQIPDYTDANSTDQLFDFKRFIAVADRTKNGPSPSKNNHFKSLASFVAALKTKNSPANPFEGVIVVDISKDDITCNWSYLESSGIKASDAPKGINVRGTLVFNFATDVKGTDYLMDWADININPADLSWLTMATATNTSLYTSGYPPVYKDSTKNPVNIDITKDGFQNFTADDDMPAMMYNVGVLDMHANANISGVIYTPSCVELEHPFHEGTTQYIRGSIICGGGCIIDNGPNGRGNAAKCISIVSYDKSALDQLATSKNKGKKVRPVFWE